MQSRIPLRVIIAGSRYFNDYEYIEYHMAGLRLPITEVVCGMADGVDKLGYRWAKRHGIPVREFPASWDDLNAGRRRNVQMANYAHRLVAFDGGTRGTQHMISTMKKLGKTTYTIPLPGHAAAKGYFG